MELFIILGVIVLVTFVVIGVLFFMLSKEGKKDETAVPVGVDQLKKELSSQIFEQKKVIEKGSEIIPVFTTQMPDALPAPSLEDEAYKKRARELEDELLSISKKADVQSVEAKQMIEVLTKENDALKAKHTELQQAQQRLMDLQTETSQLKTENIGLQSQMDSSQAKVRLLEEEMAAVKLQMGEQIDRANQAVEQLKQQNEALLAAPKPEIDEGLRKELEAVKAEFLQLKGQYADLENSEQRLREINTQLTEKNDALQYELIKARAQSSGLERVSVNYKNQLEDFFKKINAVQTSHEQLSKVKNRLEGLVQEVKMQNEELIRKDQLSQFELEKNRSRLMTLERECEDLKSRVQQKDQ